ncbi:MAG: hypothetical protein WCE90_08585 [Candidatus Zixiibacteriota bacterium]
MREVESTNHARAVLEAQGFVAEPIEEADCPGQRRADLRVGWESERYIVEAKGKDATEQYKSLLEQAQRDGLASLARELKSWNGLSSILEDAEEQLSETARRADEIRLVWLSCLHADAEYVLEAFRRRVFGLRTVMVWEPPGPRLVGDRLCFYYEFSDFFRYRGIDAVFLAREKGAQLLVNEFSERAPLLRRSHLYAVWSAANATIDPTVFVADGDAFAIHADIDRSGQKAQWKYIRETYGYLTTVCPEHHFSGLICLSVGDVPGEPS